MGDHTTRDGGWGGGGTMQPETEKYVQHLFGNIHSISNAIIKRNKNSYYFNVDHFKEYFQKILV